MTRPALLVVLMTALPMSALAADDLRVRQLEQDVRELNRRVFTLSRQVDELQRARPGRPADPGDAPAPRAADSTAWIDAAKWRRVRVGMCELEVIEVLGPPTSMREEKGARVLLYALELGSSGFLGGSVTLRDRAVAEVQVPALR